MDFEKFKTKAIDCTIVHLFEYGNDSWIAFIPSLEIKSRFINDNEQWLIAYLNWEKVFHMHFYFEESDFYNALEESDSRESFRINLLATGN